MFEKIFLRVNKFFFHYVWQSHKFVIYTYFTFSLSFITITKFKFIMIILMIKILNINNLIFKN